MSGLGLFKRFLGAERRAVPRSGEPKHVWILVVDDSATIRAVLGKMLQQDGHVVLKAGDGDSALALARQERPDLIFLDIVMPGTSGFAVLRALRHDPLTADIPIVMISGNVQATEQFYVQRYGADDFMKKPFGRSEVFARLQRLHLSGRLQVRERHAHAPAQPAIPDAEPAVIPDVAMPDPEHRDPAHPGPPGGS